MIRFDDLSVGDRLFWVSAVMVRSGVVLSIRETPKRLVCLETPDGFRELEDFRHLFRSEREAWLEYAVSLQREGADKLLQAANAFKAAGVDIASAV